MRYGRASGQYDAVFLTRLNVSPSAYTKSMALFRLLLLSSAGLSLFAQATCNNTPAYSPCEFVFELNPQEAAAHPNPYADVDLHAEFRSPHFHTFKMPAFWDGGQRLVIRFTPTEAGEWLWRLTSNIQRWEGQTGAFTAAESDAPGFVRAANVHHWAWTAGQGFNAHLWMGDTLYPLAFLDQALFQRIVDTRAAQKFNHIRGLVLGSRRSSRPRVSIARQARSRAFPASRPIHPLHESEGHRGRPDPGRAAEPAHPPVPGLAAKAALHQRISWRAMRPST